MLTIVICNYRLVGAPGFIIGSELVLDRTHTQTHQ